MGGIKRDMLATGERGRNGGNELMRERGIQNDGLLGIGVTRKYRGCRGFRVRGIKRGMLAKGEGVRGGIKGEGLTKGE